MSVPISAENAYKELSDCLAAGVQVKLCVSGALLGSGRRTIIAEIIEFVPAEGNLAIRLAHDLLRIRPVERKDDFCVTAIGVVPTGEVLWFARQVTEIIAR